MARRNGPEIVCSTGSFWRWEFDRALGILAEAGFDAVELMVTRDPRTQSGPTVQRLVQKHGLRVVAIHSPMLFLTRGVWGPNFMPIVERSAALAKTLGAEVVIIHPPYLWETRYQAWLLGKLDAFSADNGVALALENMFRLWVRGRGVRAHRWLSPDELQRFSRLTLDTSHCGADGYDILEALDQIAPQTVHVHLSDSYGDGRDNHAIPGSGKLPLRRFLERLPASGFRGALSLELNMRELSPYPKKALAALRSAREFCETHLP